MKRSRFTESQIVSILKEADAGRRSKSFAANTASAMPPITTGKQSTVA